LVLPTLLVGALAALSWVIQTTNNVQAEARQQFFNQYNRQQLLLADQAARAIENLFAGFQNDLGLVGSLFEGGEVTRKRAQQVAGDLARIYHSQSGTPVIDVAVIDRNGVVVTSIPKSPDTVGVNLSWRDYFLWAKDKARPGEIYIAPFRRLVAGKNKGKMALVAVVGIFDAKDRFKGLSLFAVGVDALADRYIRSVHIGEHGYAWLVDVANRTMLVHPQKALDGKSFKDFAYGRWPKLYQLLLSMENGQPGTASYEFEDPVDPSKVARKLMGYAPVRIGNILWMLSVATPESEVEQLLSSFLRRQELLSITLSVTILAGAIITCAALVAWNTLLSRRIDAHSRALEITKAELLVAEKLAALGQMAVGLTHEIRNPLSAVRMNVQIIREECGSEEYLRENFNILDEEILRLNGLLGDILNFARPHPLRLKRVDLAEEIVKVTQLMQGVLAEAGIALEVRQSGSLKTTCDVEQIRQVLLNLILNGIEAMKGSPAPKQLVIGATGGSQEVTLQVTDCGTGILPEHRLRVFDPFFTTKAQGGGLGLAMVQSIVQRHGGTVSVEDGEAGGTTFVVTLPKKKIANSREISA
jgi:two-component system, NtrC family, C4-dicarboxylate transport sensor histidine kinase DctB